MKPLLFLFIMCIRTIRICNSRPWNYELERIKLRELELKSAVGGNIKLSAKEEIANRILMAFKNQELDKVIQDPKTFYFKHDFLQHKDAINKSKVYDIIKSMPKGGALHLHRTMLLNAESLVQLTYENHLYACFVDDKIRFRAALIVPTSIPCAEKWILLEDLRRNTDNVKSFDDELIKYFLMNLDGAGDLDINTIWERFDKVFLNIKSLLLYRPIYEKYYYEVLKHFYNDNVRYLEIRSGLSSIYELDGSLRNSSFIVNLLKHITKEFQHQYQDFIGVKFIMSNYRRRSIEKTQEGLKNALKLLEQHPDFIVGFDVVGQEDKGKSLLEMSRLFMDTKDDIDFFFHAGETNNHGSIDENLYDSFLLNTQRIGHAYALVKHPVLMTLIKERDIALEINVISNGVLGLVKDFRNHPAATYLAYGMPVVISSDDPGVWGADPLSHDFYVTFMAVASRNADLRLLKQLALNSIKYSALDIETKQKFERTFHISWNEFITEVIHTYEENFENDDVIKDY